MKKVFKLGEAPENNQNGVDDTQQLDFGETAEWNSFAESETFFAPSSDAQDETGFFDPFAETAPAAVLPDQQTAYELGFEDILDGADSDDFDSDNFDDDSSEEEPDDRRRRRSDKRSKQGLQQLISRLKRWLGASTGNKIIAGSAGAVVIATVAMVVWLVAGAGGGNDPLGGKVDTNEVQDAISDNYTFVDESEYKGTLLTSTKDAGESYLKETLFIGDSNFARMVMYGYLTYDNVIGVESMGIQGVTGSASVYFSGYSEPVTIVKAVSLMKPRRIVICFGTNNILSNDAQDFAKAYGVALDKLHEAYSYSDIIICAIPPLGENRSNKALKQETVDDYNLALIKLAKEKGYTFLDTSEVLKGSDGYIKPDYIYTDGIHISQKGFDMFFKYVRTHAHIVDDTRPTPLGTIPKQVAPPKKEVEPDAKFDPALVASGSVSKFVAGGCKALTGTAPTTTPTSWTFTVPYDAEPGTEGNWANSLYSAYLAQKGTPTSGSTVAVSHTQNSAEFVFTVTVYPVAACATHTWKDTGKTTAATCAAVGTKEQKCEVCGAVQSVEDPTKPKLTTHTWGEYKETTAATCVADGIQTRTCTVCGAVDPTTKKGKDKTGVHSYGNWKTVTPATCKAQGLQKRYCIVCNAEDPTTNTLLIDPNAHTYGAWTTVTPATCTTQGLQKRVCACGAEETSSIPVDSNAHTWTTHDDGSKTCPCGARIDPPEPPILP